jgi:von Willebrand factor type A domain
MKRRTRAAIAAAILCGAPPLAAAQVPKQVFVSVTTVTGTPVVDLDPADFSVREGSLSRKITHAALANDTMRIALIVDSSENVSQLVNQFRPGLQSFIDALPEPTEIGLMTIGRQARMRVPPTADRKKLSDAIKGFFSDGGGTAALDGVMEGYDRILKKAENRWPLLVLITTDGGAAGSTREDEFERFLNVVQPAGVVAHAIVIALRGNGMPTVVAQDLTHATGGSYQAIAVATALPERLKALGDRLASAHQQAAIQYRIEYLSESKDAREVEVGVERTGVRIGIFDRRLAK